MPKAKATSNADVTPELPDVVIEEETTTVVEPAVVPEHPNNDELAVLIKKNIQWSEVLYQQNKKIERRLFWMAVGSYLRLAIILIPLVLGAIYLPPIIRQLLSQYDALLEVTTSLQQPVGTVISPQVQELINGLLK